MAVFEKIALQVQIFKWPPLPFEDRHLIFWILGPLLYHSRIVFQPNFKSGSRADIQGGAKSAPPPVYRELLRIPQEFGQCC